jgi:phosphotransferase system  glucose/maltose/N-acetylglucosamine-specific IIC component
MNKLINKIKEIVLIIIAILCLAGFLYGFGYDLITNQHNVEISQEDAEDIITSQQVIDMYY